MYKLLDGKLVSTSLKNELKEKINRENLNLKLVVIKVGNDEASSIYIKSKEKQCGEVGIKFENVIFDEIVTENIIINKIKELNEDNDVTSILLQLPISKHLDSKKLINCIDSSKDVDGLTTTNIGKLFNNDNPIIPCTAKGVIDLLDYYNINVEGKNVCIVGRSNLVGKPLVGLMLNRDATVSVCHSKTKNIRDYTLNADIIISAVGKVNLITSDMVNDGAIVIDVGINRVDDKIYGDVDFENVKEKCSFITPVPGGIGLMTVATLLENVYKCYCIANKK